MPHVATSPADLLTALAGRAHLDGDRLVIDDEAGVPRRRASATWPGPRPSPTDEATTAAAQWLVWEASQELGARSASIQELYEARARGEVAGFTVPAINLRAQTFDMARTVYEAAAAAGVGAVILELARSEQTYTFQRPIDYATSVLAGAIAAGWQGPVFIQGDHYQFNAKKYAADPEAMTEEIRRACRLAIDAGYRNIDIDSSTLVDLSKPNVDEEQRENYRRAAELTALIRTLETDGVTISVGGEIGEVGTQNSTVEELRAYLDGYRRELDERAPGANGHLQGQRPDRHVPRRRAAAGRRRGGGQARLRGPARARRRRPRVRPGRRRPARRVDPARRAVPPLPGGRDRRDPPGDRVPERALRAPGLPGLAPSRDRGLVLRRTPPTSASPARPTSSSCTRPARRRSGRSSASSGTSRRRTRSSPPSAARSPTCSPSCGSTTPARWSTGYVHPVELHRPMPDALREAVSAG